MSLQTKLDYQYKYLFLGDTNVGKTSLLIRYTESIFDPESLPTLGVDVRYKYVTLENKRIRLDIWDTAGQERFKMITKNYLNGANGIIFVYDITSKDTFDKLKLWIKEAESNVSPDTEMSSATSNSAASLPTLNTHRSYSSGERVTKSFQSSMLLR